MPDDRHAAPAPLHDLLQGLLPGVLEGLSGWTEQQRRMAARLLQGVASLANLSGADSPLPRVLPALCSTAGAKLPSASLH